MIGEEFIKTQYNATAKSYAKAVDDIGLWASEKYLIEKYFHPKMKILDIGCGAGRTSFAMIALGYDHIIAIDLSADMIHEALAISKRKKVKIDFSLANILNYKSEYLFDAALFSFNGLMSIPKHENRMKALLNIKNNLVNNGIFIFSTHDRYRNESYYDFWINEKIKWDKGLQNKQLHDYGDILFTLDGCDAKQFVHISSEEEVREMLYESNFEILESFYRSDMFDENDLVKKFSVDCRFWICKSS